MRKLITALTILVAIYCSSILLIPATSAIAQQKQGVDSLQWYKRKCDTLAHQRLVEAYKYNMLKRYVKVVIKRPKSTIYLKSWLRNVDAVKE